MGVPEFESGTSSLSATRSNQLSYTPESYQQKPHFGKLFRNFSQMRTSVTARRRLQVAHFMVLPPTVKWSFKYPPNRLGSPGNLREI